MMRVFFVHWLYHQASLHRAQGVMEAANVQGQIDEERAEEAEEEAVSSAGRKRRSQSVLWLLLSARPM
jgi:hypothetical protein